MFRQSLLTVDLCRPRINYSLCSDKPQESEFQFDGTARRVLAKSKCQVISVSFKVVVQDFLAGLP